MWGPFTHQYIEDYKTAAAGGAAVEVMMRLLADKIPSLQRYAHEEKLSNVEDAVTQHFRTSLSDAERDTLRLSRELRNKIIHCDFHVVRDRLEKLDGHRPDGTADNVIGWLHELGMAGDFQRAIAAFERAETIVSRLYFEERTARI
jgi:hypothetical protein